MKKAPANSMMPILMLGLCLTLSGCRTEREPIRSSLPTAASVQPAQPPSEKRGFQVQGMIREIKGFPLLDGFRGREPVDISILEEILLKVSGFVDEHPEIKELDLNPIFAYKDGAIAVDARVILEAT